MSMRYSIPCPLCGKDHWKLGVVFAYEDYHRVALTLACDSCRWRSLFSVDYSLVHDLVRVGFRTLLPRVPTVRSRPWSWQRWNGSEKQTRSTTVAIQDYIPRYHDLEELPGLCRNFCELPTIRPLIGAMLETSVDAVIDRKSYERSLIALGQDLAP